MTPLPRSIALVLAVVVTVALVGLLDLAQPLAGDQSLFLLGAREMHAGGVLYRDFWDLKQPGIYVFYLLAGSVGSFEPLAVHAFELAYFLGFALVAFVALRRFGHAPVRAALKAALVTVPYFLFSTYYEELQVEALVGVPLFLAIWLAAEGARDVRTGRRIAWLASAGAACAVVLAFKLLFLPLLVLTLAAALPMRRRSIVDAAWIGTAAALATVPELAYFAAHGALGVALKTWFTLPPEILATIPAQDPHALADGATIALKRFMPLVAFAAVGIAIAVRRNLGPFDRAALAWLVAGPLTIVAQRTSWWEYQWLLLLVPLGLFAATGIAATLHALTSPRSDVARRVATGTLVVVLLGIVPGRELGFKVSALAAHGFAADARQREAFRAQLSTPYRDARADRDLVPRSGSLYVMGDPAFYLLTDREQPIALNGWALELLVPAQRVQLERELRAHPPTYIYQTYDDAGPQTLLARTPSLRAYLARAYRLRAIGVFGKLYALRDSQTTTAAAYLPTRPSPR